MSDDERIQSEEVRPDEPASLPPAEPEPMPARSRPKIDLTKDRRRGKSAFGIVLGTLNKAKIEDKERNASEAAKKRQLIDQRLQNKLKRETESVRRAEEAKKDKVLANRKEEELQLKDSLFKLRRKRLPQLANFLLTSDVIPIPDDNPPNPLALPPRTHPPPLYYLPAVLLPEQEVFLARRKAEVAAAAEKEWEDFRTDRAAGIAEIEHIRQRVADEEAKRRNEAEKDKEQMETDAPPPNSATDKPAEMEVDDQEKSKDGPAPIQADDEEAVEY